MEQVVRIRTVEETVKMLHEEDSGNSGITVRGLRVAIKNGEIPHRKVGKKVLLNYDVVRRYYMMEDGQELDGQAHSV